MSQREAPDSGPNAYGLLGPDMGAGPIRGMGEQQGGHARIESSLCAVCVCVCVCVCSPREHTCSGVRSPSPSPSGSRAEQRQPLAPTPAATSHRHSRGQQLQRLRQGQFQGVVLLQCGGVGAGEWGRGQECGGGPQQWQQQGRLWEEKQTPVRGEGFGGLGGQQRLCQGHHQPLPSQQHLLPPTPP